MLLYNSFVTPLNSVDSLFIYLQSQVDVQHLQVFTSMSQAVQPSVQTKSPAAVSQGFSSSQMSPSNLASEMVINIKIQTR